jgi:hypothetical protein
MRGFVMGRTVLPFSRVLEQEVQEWRKFRRGLRKEDQQFLDRLFEEARLHVQAGVYASRPWPFETILVSILLEHEKALVELRSKLGVLEKKGVILSDSEESSTQCHPEPFACHSEGSEESLPLAQGKLREGSHKIDTKDSSLPTGRQGLTPQNDVLMQPLDEKA